MRQTILLSALAASASVFAAPVQSDATDYSGHARAAVKTLVSLYDPSTGLWQDQWWNSANSLNTIADYHAVNAGFSSTTKSIYEHTFTNAQKTSKQAFGHPLPGFKNPFYDDMGWWAMAWIKVFDNTGNKTYLDMAESIFRDQTEGISDHCGGGIYESTNKQNINAIPTELFISTAAHLAMRVPDKKQAYLDHAVTQWKWLSEKLMDSNGLIRDHLNASTCKPNPDIWSYNQGVILGGLNQLHKLTGESSYISEANAIAETFIKKFGKHGVVDEFCSPGCDDTTVDMFKGVFMRNLGALVKSQGNGPATLKKSVLENARAVWDNARTNGALFRNLWTPGNHGAANYDSTTAAVDALVAGAVIA